MLKLMIVEDEENIREGLAELIKWETAGFELPTKWSSAIEALSYLEHERVDVIITDIFMPVMTGLEFARMVKTTHPNTEVIILTGHERFELAQEAIAIGVRRYLLKPIQPNELSELLIEVRQELEERIILRDWITITEQKLIEYMPVVQERFFRDLLSGKISGTDQVKAYAKMAELDLNHHHFICFAVRLFHRGQTQLSQEVAVRQIIREFLGAAYIYSLNYEGMEAVIVNKVPADGQLELLLVSIKENLNLAGCIGIGGIYEAAAELCKSAAEAVRAAKFIRSREGLKILRHGDIVYWREEGSQYPYEIEKRLFDSIRFREKLEEKILQEFFQAAMPPHHSEEKARLIMLQFLAAIHRLGHEHSVQVRLALADIEQNDEPEVVQERFRQALERLVEDIKESHEHYVTVMVKQVKKVIQEQYSNPELTVIYLADKLGITPNYLSRIFSSQTGETCIEYLTKVRMEAAREMLLHSDKKSYVIASETGYKNPNYFSALFKKVEGLSPREFRERNQK